MNHTLRTILFGFLLWSFGFGTGAMFWSRVDTAPPSVVVASDKKTGCQYMLSPGNGITPRIDRDGLPVCDKGIQ